MLPSENCPGRFMLLACRKRYFLLHFVFHPMNLSATAFGFKVISRRLSCIMLLHFVLLHTVRMTWRYFPCFLTRGTVREHLCEQYCVQCHDSRPSPALRIVWCCGQDQ